MDSITNERVIAGKPARVTLIFDAYGEAKFRKDFAWFVNYQLKRNLTGEKGEALYKFYKVDDFRPIPYEEYRQQGAALFSEVIFRVLMQNPSIIASDQLTVQVKIVRGEFLEYQSKDMVSKEFIASDEENACFIIPGDWLLQAIVAPHAYLSRIDYQYVFRYFSHELTHFMDDLRGKMAWDSGYEEKTKRLARRKSAYVLNRLYETLFHLREEGLAELNSRSSAPTRVIDVEGGRTFGKRLEKLASLRLKREAYPFYIKKLGWDNLTSSGEGANGQAMAFTIALAVARERGVPLSATVTARFGRTHKWFGKTIDFGAAFRQGIRIEVTGITQEVLEETRARIGPTVHYFYVKLYERACDALGIREEDRIITSKRFFALKRKAIQVARDERRKRLADAGFADVTTDPEEPPEQNV